MQSLTQKIGSDFQINTQTDDAQQFPAAAVLENGRFVVTWTTKDPLQDGSGDAIKARLFNADGTAFGNEFLVNTKGALDQSLSKVTALSDSRFLISWTTTDPAQDGHGLAIKARLFTANGQPAGDEFLVNTAAAGDQQSVTAAGLDEGFVIAWITPGADGGLSIRRFDEAGAPIGAEFKVANSAGATAPSIASLGDDKFIIAWSSGDGDIKARIGDDTGNLSTERTVNNQTAGAQSSPIATGLAQGGIAVTWTTSDAAQDGSGSAIKARVLNEAGSPIGNEFLVNTSAAGDQVGPAMKSLPDGGFAIAWSGSGTSDTRARVFREDGEPEGDEFVLSASGPQASVPALAATVDGRLLATWTSQASLTGDTSGSSVRGALFSLDLTPFAGDDSFLTKANEAVTVQVSALLANDRDLQNRTVTFTAVMNPTDGVVVRDGNAITFTPAAGFTGEAGFDYTVVDRDGRPDTAHVSVFVVPQTFPVEWRLFTPDNFKGEIGGNGTVNGSNGIQEIFIRDLPGVMTFDPSFNRGRDIIHLADNAEYWSIARTGSSAILLRDETVVVIPLGEVATKLVFDDGSLNLRFDATAGVGRIGSQTFTTTAAPITAVTTGGELPDTSNPAAVSRLFLDNGAEVTLNGNYSVFGTAGGEYIDFIGGKLQLDPSFNRGGDTLALNDVAENFTAQQISSSVKFVRADGAEVVVPIGTEPTLLSFDGDERDLYFDATQSVVLLGTQVIDSLGVTLIA